MKHFGYNQYSVSGPVLFKRLEQCFHTTNVNLNYVYYIPVG